jgi:hypothetical protein
MKRWRPLALLAAGGLLFGAALPAFAWPDQPFAQIDITGKGIPQVASVTDPDLLRPLTIEGFMDFSHSVPAPQMADPGYTLVRYFRVDGELRRFDRVVYYPKAGYVYYAEGYDYRPVWNAGHWFRVTPAGEAAMQTILFRVVAPDSPPAPAPLPWPALAGAAFAALLAAAAAGGVLWQRRAARRRMVTS